MSEHAEPKPVDDRPAETELAPHVATERETADALAVSRVVMLLVLMLL